MNAVRAWRIWPVLAGMLVLVGAPVLPPVAFGAPVSSTSGPSAPANCSTSSSGASGTIDQPPADGQTFTSNPASFAGHFSVSGGVITNIDLAIVTANGGTEIESDPLTYQNPQPDQPFTWAPELDSNGSYILQAVATWQDRPNYGAGCHTVSATRAFYVSIPPSRPENLDASFESSSRAVRLSWAANPEPDLHGYDIYRKDPTSPTFQFLVSLGLQVSYLDTSVETAPAGPYAYEVTAYRDYGTGKCCEASLPSDPAPVNVTGPPVTTTVPPPPPAGTSGGSGSGQAPGGSSGGTAPGASVHGAAGGGSPVPASVPLPAPERVDAGDFSNLLNQARASTVTTAPDAYNPALPFGTSSGGALVDVPGAAQLASGPSPGGDSRQRHRLTMEYLAGALLLFVLAMHALYLKRRLDRELLETVQPLAYPLGGSSALAALPSSTRLLVSREEAKPHSHSLRRLDQWVRGVLADDEFEEWRPRP